MKAMEQQQLPVLPRLDRLDRLLQLLEEKHSMSGRQLSDYHHVVRHQKGPEKHEEEEEEEDERKSLSSALDEVHHKGTLMDRVATLENRVLQLISMEMDEVGNTSRSSSSTVLQVSKNVSGTDHDLNTTTTTTTTTTKVSRQEDHKHEEYETTIQPVDPLLIQEETMINKEVDDATQSTSGDRSGKGQKKKGGYMIKWTRWFRCGQLE